MRPALTLPCPRPCARGRQMEERWKEEKATLMKAEERNRKERQDAFKQRVDESLPSEVRDMVLSRVRLHGLAARPELNGRMGVARVYVPDKGRFAVSVDAEAGEKPVEILLKPANLTLVSKVDADGIEIDDDAEQPPLM